MKKLLLLFCALSILSAIGVFGRNMIALYRDNQLIDNVICNDSVEYTIISNTEVEVSKVFSNYYTNGYNESHYVPEMHIPEIVECGGQTYTVVGIGASAFYKVAFQKITLPNTIRYIGGSAFGYNTYITELKLPENLEKIGAQAFYACINIEEMYIPDKVKYIGAGAFCDCISLRKISIGGNVTEIGDYAFWVDNLYYNDPAYLNLKVVEFRDGTTPIALGNGSLNVSMNLRSDIDETAKNHHGMFRCVSLDSVYIGRDITYPYLDDPTYTSKINWEPFKLVFHIELGETVTSIPSKLFYKQSFGDFIKLPPRLEHIGEMAFYGCSAANRKDYIEQKTLTLPSTIRYIGSNAFYDTNIQNFICQAENPFTLGTDALLNIKSIPYDNDMRRFYYRTVIVPDGCGEVFRNAWPDYIIVDKAEPYTEIKTQRAGRIDLYAAKAGVDDYSTVLKLKLTGPLNNEDMAVIKSKMTNMYSIDLSEAQIDTIPEYEFSDLVLTDVKLPRSVKYIGKCAFPPHLASDTVCIPNTCEYIGDGAFAQSTIKNVIIDCDSVIIGSAFARCPHLKNIRINGKGKTELGAYAFTYVKADKMWIKGVSKFGDNSLDVTINDILELTGVDAALSKAIGTRFVCPDTIAYYEAIPADAGCLTARSPENLKKAMIEGPITELPSGIFRECKNLENIDVPSSVKRIGDAAFYRCSKIKNIDIPEGLEAIGSSAFGGATSLSLTNIPDGVKTIGVGAFTGIKSLTMDRFPSQLKHAGMRAFYEIEHLNIANLALPDSLQYIEDSAFEGCELIITKLPEGLVGVYSGAFNGCTFDADTIFLPRTLAEIGANAFDFSEVTHVVAFWQDPIEVDDKAFGKPFLTTLHVPSGSWEKYDDSKGWYWFGDFSEFAMLDIASTGNGTLSYGGKNTASGPKSYMIDDVSEISIDITPDDGYMLEYVMRDGDFVTNTLASDDNLTIATSGANVKVEVNFVPFKRYGDANGDDLITLADVTSIVSYINEDEPQEFVFYAADVNRDRRISPIDINLSVDKVLSEPLNTPAYAKNMSAEAAANQNVLGYSQSSDYMVFSLNAVDQLVALQFDMTIPASSEFKLNNLMSTNHQCIARRLSDESVRIIVFSADNSALPNAPIIGVNCLLSETEMEVYNIRVVDSNLHEHIIRECSDLTTSGIMGLDTLPVQVQYYDINGRKVNDPGAGIYIERTTLQSGRVVTRKIVRY